MERFIQALITSPMRTGSTWVCEIIGDTLKECKTYLNEEASERIVKYKVWTPTGQLCKSHSIFPESFDSLMDVNPTLKIIRVQRNDRDMLASRFYFARYHSHHSDLHRDAAYQEDLNDYDLLKHMIRNSDVIHKWLDHIRRYKMTYEHSRFLDITYENLVQGDDLRKVCLFLNLDFMLFHKAIERNEFNRMQELEQKKFQRDGKSLFRREGKVGKGAELFTDELYEILTK